MTRLGRGTSRRLPSKDAPIFFGKPGTRPALYICAALLPLLALAFDCCDFVDEALRSHPERTPVAPPLAPSSPTPAPPRAPSVEIGGVAFSVMLADTPEDRAMGLSYRDSMASSTGMLFVFESPHAASFWMREMRFPLDFVWIGEDCSVVDITPNVPNPLPGTPKASLPMYRPAAPILYNLEINAGEAERYGIRIGDRVRFEGMPVEADGC